MNTLFIIKHIANDNTVTEEKFENVARVTAMIRFLEIVEEIKSNRVANLDRGAILIDGIEDKAILSFKLTGNTE